MEAGHTDSAPSARALLTDDAPEVRASALRALARLERVDDDDLAAAAQDPDHTVRRTAAEVAAHHGRSEVLGALLGDSRWEVAEAAAWACGERAEVDDGTHAVLRRVAGAHADALVREAAVAALGTRADPHDLPVILAALDEPAAIRRRAVLALAPFDDPRVDAALERCLDDRDVQVRQGAEDLLAVDRDDDSGAD